MDSFNSQDIMSNTKSMIDDLKTVCTNFGLGNASSEYKIITELFLYKFLNDKFLYEIRKVDEDLSKSDNLEATLSKLSNNEYDILLMSLSPETATLKRENLLSYLFNHKNVDDFDKLFDNTLLDIANSNIDIFSVKTGSADKIRLFDKISVNVTETNKRADFCRAMIDKLINFSFERAFSQKYDFFATIFEYLIKDYNKDFGKYAEYYTPHSIATIIAKILAPNGDINVEIYDPSAGSGTLVLALAHQIGENNCTLYTQDISQKSNEFLRLNLILNDLVHSLNNVVHGDTLLNPQHLNRAKNGLKKFDYIVSNPPFKVDFSDNRNTLAGDNFKSRFWAGVPNIPNKKKDSMAIYLMFLQHIIYSLKDNGKASVVVPTGFLTAQNGIELIIRKKLVDNHWLKGVISMPSNIFATTGTNVSILFIDKSNVDGSVMLLDASKLGSKVKEDGKNQKTVLSNDEISKIENTFINQEVLEDFSVCISYDDISNKNYSFSAGQYFEVKIDYVELSQEEFNQKMDTYTQNLQKLFADGKTLEDEIKAILGELKYENS